jgi:acetyl esterase/lipase
MNMESNIVSFLDIPYAGQSEAQKLDILLPDGGKKPYPVILLIHGGGFEGGDKNEYLYNDVPQALAKGYAVVSINYRLSSEAKFPAQIFDAKAAVRYIRANATKYDFDPARIVALGFSAGGYLAALLGTSGDVPELEDLSMGNADQSSRINAAVVQAAPIDFLEMDRQHRLLKHNLLSFNDVEDGAESKLIGGLISKFPEKCRAANPMTYIKDDNPPFYIQYSKNDAAIPYLQGIMLGEYLKAVIGESKVVLDISETGGHGPEPFGPPGTGPGPGQRVRPMAPPPGSPPPGPGLPLDKVFVFLDKVLKVNNLLGC